ncbi:MAG: hypothetical protein ACREPK_04330 [Rhodanobacteraceae bacterium]
MTQLTFLMVPFRMIGNAPGKDANGLLGMDESSIIPRRNFSRAPFAGANHTFGSGAINPALLSSVDPNSGTASAPGSSGASWMTFADEADAGYADTAGTGGN